MMEPAARRPVAAHRSSCNTFRGRTCRRRYRRATSSPTGAQKTTSA